MANVTKCIIFAEFFKKIANLFFTVVYSFVTQNTKGKIMNIQPVNQTPNRQPNFGIKLKWEGDKSDITTAKEIFNEFIGCCTIVPEEHKILNDALDFAERAPGSVTAEHVNGGVRFSSETLDTIFIKRGFLTVKQMALNLRDFFAGIYQSPLSNDIRAEQMIRRFNALS